MVLPILAVLLSISAVVAADTDSISISQILEEIPTCGAQCYHAALGHNEDSFSPVSDFCYEDDYWGKTHDCILQQCSTLDQFKFNKIQSEICNQPTQTRERRFYLMLAAEIPAWICPLLRLFASWRSSDGLRIDDYVMLACGFSYTVYVGCVHYVHHTIFDVSASTIDSEEVSSALEMLFIAEKFAVVCLALGKVAIIYFYLRTFAGARFRAIALTMFALIIVPTIAFLFVLIFQCSPISFAWEGWALDSSPQQCLNAEVIAYVKQAFDIGQNTILISLPLPFLHQLGMSFRVKLGTMAIFALGALSLGMSGMRLRFTILQGAEDKPNQPWEYADQLIWTGVEIAALIVIACLPSIWKLFPASHERKPAALTSRPPSTRYLRDKPLPPIRTRSNASEKKKGGVYTVNTKSAVTESQQELDLRLGDKTRGDVWTQIKGGHRFSGFSMVSHMSEKIGIRVKTTTTTRVDIEESEFEESGIVTPRTGPLSP